MVAISSGGLGNRSVAAASLSVFFRGSPGRHRPPPKLCSRPRLPRTGLDERPTALVAEHPSGIPGAEVLQVRGEQPDQLRWDRHNPHRVRGDASAHDVREPRRLSVHSWRAQGSDPAN